MFGQIKWIIRLSGTPKSFIRKKAIVIRQVETTKMSRAEKIKKQNYETANLYGPKVKQKATKINQNPPMDSTNNGKNSEMHWVLSNRNGKLSKINSSVIQVGVEEANEKKQLGRKKESSYAQREEKLSETFAKFKHDLPQPVKITIQDALNNLDLNTATKNANKQNIREIPFDQKQLRSMADFPLILDQNDLMSDIFDKTIIMKRQINFTPSVSKILQATMSPSQKNALVQWKNLKIAELGLEGFEAMQKEYLSRGKLFHDCVQKYFNNVEINEDQLPTNVRELWKSISYVLREFEAPAMATEKAIFHPHLRYKGIVDCVSLHQKSRTISVIEWKNSDRHKKSVQSTFDAPLQLCAYLAALNATEYQNDPLKSGIIVIAYNDGQSADLFHLSPIEINRYWKSWLNRLQEYWIRYRDNTLPSEDI